MVVKNKLNLVALQQQTMVSANRFDFIFYIYLLDPKELTQATDIFTDIYG